MSTLTLDELGELIDELRAEHPGETPVHIAYQPNHPLFTDLSCVRVCEFGGEPALFLAGSAGGGYLPWSVDSELQASGWL